MQWLTEWLVLVSFSLVVRPFLVCVFLSVFFFFFSCFYFLHMVFFTTIKFPINSHTKRCRCLMLILGVTVSVFYIHIFLCVNWSHWKWLNWSANETYTMPANEQLLKMSLLSIHIRPPIRSGYWKFRWNEPIFYENRHHTD